MKLASLLGARAVMLLHYGFLLFVLFGALLFVRWPGLLWWHLPLVVWGVLVVVMSWDCPLTTLENALLKRAGKPTYSVGFIDYYLASWLFPKGMPRSMQVGMGVFLLLVNAGAYSWLFLQGRG
jgi:hypothetical protein